MRHRHHEHDRSEVDRENADPPAEELLEQQRQQNRARAGGEHSQKNPERPEHRGHGDSEQNDGGETKVTEVVGDAALQHLDDVRRAGHVNPEIARIRFVNNPFQPGDKSSRIAAASEKNHVG